MSLILLKPFMQDHTKTEGFSFALVKGKRFNVDTIDSFFTASAFVRTLKK